MHDSCFMERHFLKLCKNPIIFCRGVTSKSRQTAEVFLIVLTVKELKSRTLKTNQKLGGEFFGSLIFSWVSVWLTQIVGEKNAVGLFAIGWLLLVF